MDSSNVPLVGSENESHNRDILNQDTWWEVIRSVILMGLPVM